MSMLLGWTQVGSRSHVSMILKVFTSSLCIFPMSCMFRNTWPAPSEARCSVLPVGRSIAPATFPVFASMAVSRLLPRSAVNMSLSLES